MIYETSYGVVALLRGDTERYTILVQLASGQHRGFPKGHPEHNETIKETIQREFFEEVGVTLSYQIDESKIYTEEYIIPDKNIHKTVQYYTVQLPYTLIPTILNTQSSSERDGEILKKKICTFQEAKSQITYDQTRTILEQVEQDIHTNHQP